MMGKVVLPVKISNQRKEYPGAEKKEPTQDSHLQKSAFN